jgi:hypothetical protein
MTVPLDDQQRATLQWFTAFLLGNLNAILILYVEVTYL